MVKRRDGNLTKREKRAASLFAETGNRVLAVTDAGYLNPEKNASQVLNRPTVIAEVVRIQTERLNRDLLPLAVGALERLLINPLTPAGAIVQAAKVVLDRTVGGQDEGRGKAPNELTGDELQRQIDRLRQEAAARANPIIEGTAVEVKRSVFD